MTKKHFDQIASKIKAMTEMGYDQRTLRVIALQLCAPFGEDNPRFDSNRFLTACGF